MTDSTGASSHAVSTEEVRRYGAYVAGRWQAAQSGQEFETRDPATGAVVAVVAQGDAADIDGAVLNSKEAQVAWWAVLPSERGRILGRIATALRDDLERLATIETRDNGKPLAQARNDVETAARYFEFYAGLADKIHGDTIPLGDGLVSYTRREPYGVVGVIIPWNAPINQAARSIAPALVSGNSVVAKPAEQTPLTCLELAEIATRCGLPSGVLNVVPGFGETAGSALVEHSLVGKVVFTGSVETGRIVAATAGERLKPVTLELGGKSANIIFEDADIGQAVRGAVIAINANSGQVCSAGSRLLVHESIHDTVIEQLTKAYATLTVGSGTDDLIMGPLTSEEQLNKVRSYLSLAKEEGARVITGGANELPTTGWFTQPVILTGVTNNMHVAREEIFGPVLSVIPFQDDDEAVRIANDSDYGLVAGVWTQNLARAHRVASLLEVGQVFVNEYFAGGVETPFGGYKNSGYGREKGVEAIHDYTRIKTVTIKL
ncbi:MAG TPA: aldehyde dehydrogenase family protein [Tepidiformaceae bacterium]